jgi:hypothetical protein
LIGILDPALFDVRDPQEAKWEIEEINRMCRHDGVRIPRMREYWHRLWDEFGKPFERSLTPQGQKVVQALRNGAMPEGNIPLFDEATMVWRSGFDEMFGQRPGDWQECMSRTIARAAWTGEDVVLLTRRIPDRNARQHSAADVTLDEVTRWMLYVQCKGQHEPRRVRCVHHRRNLTVPWTIRFDWRLPATWDRAKYPFCPSDRWWKRSTTAWRTVESKPAWVDAQGNGWTRPNINRGSGGHWDVFIQDAHLAGRIGLNQVNITEYSEQPQGRSAGSIHHTPEKKKPHLKDIGWSCP